MKKNRSLSDLIQQVNQSDYSYTLQEVQKLIDSGKKPDSQNIHSYHPRKVIHSFNHLKFIVMMSIVGVIGSFLVLVFSIQDKVAVYNNAIQQVKETVLELVDFNRNYTEGKYKQTQLIFDTSNSVYVQNEVLKNVGLIGDDYKTSRKGKINSFLEEKSKVQDTKDEVTISIENASLVEPVLKNMVWLDRSIMPCLGIGIRNDSLVYTYNSSDTSNQVEETKRSMGIPVMPPASMHEKSDKRNITTLFAITDNPDGASALINSGMYYSEDTLVNQDDWIDFCIPVRFFSSPDQIGYGTTFWFYPSEELFNCFPDSIADPIRKEFNINVVPILQAGTRDEEEVYYVTGVLFYPDMLNTEKQDPVPCEYFPSSCEGLPGLDNLNVYPNPVSNKLNIDLSFMQAKTIHYMVLDITGNIIYNELGSKSYPSEGKYSEQLDFSLFKPGMYIIVLTDEYGARISKRVLKN